MKAIIMFSILAVLMSTSFAQQAHAQIPVPNPTCSELGTCKQVCLNQNRTDFFCPLEKQYTERIGGFAYVGFWGVIMMFVGIAAKGNGSAILLAATIGYAVLLGAGVTIFTNETADIMISATIIYVLTLGIYIYLTVRRTKDQGY